MAKGEYGPTDTPKKAIQAMEIIYKSSSFLGCIGNTIPTTDEDEMKLKFNVTVGTPGEYDVGLSAKIEPSKLAYTELETNLVWSKYLYGILDDSKLTSAKPKQLWKDATKSASDYFGAVKDYQCTTVMSAGVASSHTALGGNWDTDTAEIENDIVKAIQYIVANSNVQANETFSVIYPADVSFELMKLDLIGNVQMTLKKYLTQSFNIELRPFRALKDEDGTAVLDALSDDCLVYVNGRDTCRHGRYSRSAASANGLPLVEHTREFDRGDLYVQRMASQARVNWDGYNSTNTKSAKIYKILDVT